MTTSLKSFLPVISRVVGESVDALYERQRALVREGLLEALPGHGRGSGVRADASAVAMLLISLVATVSLSKAASRSRELAEASCQNGRCGLTGEKTFHGALTRLLLEEKLAKKVTELRVITNEAVVQIVHGSKRETFVNDDRSPHDPTGLSIEITLSGDILRRLAAATVDLSTGADDEG